jgi:hypothetical protein
MCVWLVQAAAPLPNFTVAGCCSASNIGIIS